MAFRSPVPGREVSEGTLPACRGLKPKFQLRSYEMSCSAGVLSAMSRVSETLRLHFRGFQGTNLFITGAVDLNSKSMQGRGAFLNRVARRHLEKRGRGLAQLDVRQLINDLPKLRIVTFCQHIFLKRRRVPGLRRNGNRPLVADFPGGDHRSGSRAVSLNPCNHLHAERLLADLSDLRHRAASYPTVGRRACFTWKLSFISRLRRGVQ